MPNINLSIPSFAGMDLSDEKTLRKLTSYLYKLDEQLRYVLNNLGEDNLSDSLRTVINTSADATVINELTGKLQRLNTQIIQTAEAITLKASQEELDALGDTLNESVAKFELTAEQLRTEISETEKGLQTQIIQTAEAIRSEASDTEKGLQSQINQQAGQISLSVQTANSAQSTANSAASAAADAQATANEKLDADAPSVGVETGNGITINEQGVYVAGKEIDLRTVDGDDFVNISDSGVSASSVRAADVMPRYDKWDTIVVSHDETQYVYSNVFRSLQDAFNQLNGKVVDTNVSIELEFSDTEYGDATLQGAVLLKNLTIKAVPNYTPVIAGTLYIEEGCSGNIFINGIDFQPPNGKNGISAGGEVYVEVTDGVFTGNNSGIGYGVIKYRGGSAYVYHCEFYDFNRAVVARAAAQVTMIECKGNCKINADRGGAIFACRYMPDSSTSFSGEESWGGKIFTDNTYVDQGSGGSTPTPTVSTASYRATSTGSYAGSGSEYRNEVGQGWYSSIGRIRGCMWFDNSSIRSNFPGSSTVLSASIRLSMRENVGRGASVTVELCGTAANSGASSAAVTKNYGVLGTASPGEIVTFTIPNEAAGDLISGTINGLMLYSSDTGAYKERSYSKNYALFDGADALDDAKPMLTITAQ